MWRGETENPFHELFCWQNCKSWYILISWIFPLFIANGALTENGTGNTPIQDASGISQTSKLSSELQEEHRGSNSPEPSKSDHSTVSLTN